MPRHVTIPIFSSYESGYTGIQVHCKFIKPHMLTYAIIF